MGVHSFLPVLSITRAHFNVGAHSFLPINKKEHTGRKNSVEVHSFLPVLLILVHMHLLAYY